MRRFVLLMIIFASVLPFSAEAYDVLILQSRRDQASDEVLKGFRFAEKSSLRLLVLSDYADVDIVRIVREERPRVILAVGDAALRATSKIPQTPVVAVLSLGIHTMKASRPNLAGVSMYASPERYIGVFQSMKTRRIGVIYNPARSGWYVRLARKSAEAAGIELVVREVSTPRETIERLPIMAGKVDAIWMLPDSTAVTRETTEAYFRFGQQQSVPVLSFAASYLGLGAAAVLEIDRVAMGRQADEIVAALLKDTRKENIPISFPAGIAARTNPGVMKRLGYTLNESEFRWH